MSWMRNKTGQMKQSWRSLSLNHKALLMAALVVVVALVCLKMQRTAVTARRGAEQFSRAVQVGVIVAGSKNQQALSAFEAELNLIMARQFPGIEHQAQQAAQDISSFGSCGKLIASLVNDRIRHTNSTEQYVDERMQAHLGGPMKKLSEELEKAILRFELSLKGNTAGLARELAQANPRCADKTIALPHGLQPGSDVTQALNNLGLNGLTTCIVVPFDVWAVLSAKTVKSLGSKVAATAARMFARPAAAAAAEVTVAAADGPLPIGDIIAVIGGVWTICDVHSTQKKFEREMQLSMDNMMPAVRCDIQKKVMDHALALLQEHQRLQDEIRQESEREFLK